MSLNEPTTKKKAQEANVRNAIPNFTFLLLLFLIAATADAQTPQPFITKWTTNSDGESITIPTSSSYTSYSYSVDWGDGTVDNTTYTGNATHAYASAGTYNVSITGTLPAVDFGECGCSSTSQLQSVEQWGDIEWQSMHYAFSWIFNLKINATDAPDLSQVTDMSYMFFASVSFNSDISQWNVSHVTNMSWMFYDANSFNGNLSQWDVSHVTDMSYMFSVDIKFNGDISQWDVSSVTNMSNMFNGAYAFNGDLSQWDVSHVTDMSNMFAGIGFKGNLNNWNVSSVTNMSGMFNGAVKFNGNIGSWNVGNVTNMTNMFAGTIAFNGDLSGWDVSSVNNMSGMFSNATLFNQSLDNWNIGSVQSMSNMLDNSGLSLQNYTHTLDGWAALGNVPSSITLGAASLRYCDDGAHSTLINTKGWSITGDQVSGLEPDMKSLPTIISSSPITVASLIAPTATSCANGSIAGTPDITSSSITQPTIITWTYTDGANTAQQKQHVFIGTQRPFITKWKTNSDGESILIPTNKNYSTYSYSVDWGDGTVDNTIYTGDATHTYASAGTYNVSITGALPAVDFGECGCSSTSQLQSVEQWGDIEWQSMHYAFSWIFFLKINATDAPDLSQVTDMSNMFYASVFFNSDISQWNVSNVTNMSNMFYDANSFNGNLSQWDVSHVTDMSGMFAIDNQFNGDISQWDVSSVTDMSGMFNDASAFNQSLGNWNISNVSSFSSMFNSSGLSVANYTQTLTGWAALSNVPQDAILGAQNLRYCDATAHNTLTSTYGWTINGDTQDCSLTITPAINQSTSVGDTLRFTISANYTGSGTLAYELTGTDDMSIDGSTGLFSWTPSQVGNYAVTFIASDGTVSDRETITITVSKGDQTISFSSLDEKTYGDASFDLTATTTSGLTMSYASSDTSVAKINGSTITVVGAGETTITASQTGDSNYNPAIKAQTLTVNKAALTVTADNQSKTYGTDNPELTMSYVGFVNGDDTTKITTPSISTTVTASSSVGTYDITLSGGIASNYDLTLNNGTLTVNKAVLTVTADNQSKTYGADNPELTMIYAGFVNGDDATKITTPSISTTVTASSSVGTYDITLSGGMASNYDLTLQNGTMTVNKASLIAKADNKSKTYGKDVPDFNIIYSGFVNGDDSTKITVPTASTTATASSNVGEYDIVLTGGSATNYNLTLQNGTLTITKATQTITFASIADHTLGDTAFILTATSDAGLTISYSSSNDTIASINDSTLTLLQAGHVTITASQDGNENYDRATSVSQSFCINPIKPTISLSGINTANVTLTSSSSLGNQWFENNEAINNATNVIYQTSDDGVYTVQVTIDGCQSVMSDQQTIVITGVVEKNTVINVYPTVANEYLNIEMPENSTVLITVYNLSGRMMITGKELNERISQVNVGGFSQGMYLLRVQNLQTNQFSTFKFIKE